MTVWKVLLVAGTRPELIKLVPVLLAMRADPDLQPVLVTTGQHRVMLDQVSRAFGVEPDVDLDLMREGQTPADVTSRVLDGMSGVLRRLDPAAMLVHGDTTSCLAAAMAGFFARVPVGHVEAGLRTYDFEAPWPEEMARRLTDPLARWCFAPTERAAENLRQERVPPDRIYVTGNTVVDALQIARERIRRDPPALPALPDAAIAGRRLVLVTGHRRESFGEPLGEVCLALRDLVRARPDVVLVYPVHLNPNVRGPVNDLLGREPRVHLIEPLEYLPFVSLMAGASLIITDSGGIQEEAPTFGVPVLVTRRSTERPEAVDLGLARLVGTSRARIVSSALELLELPRRREPIEDAVNPYGDGRAGVRIAGILADSLRRHHGRPSS
jgi:UDP-N-acetylglucosamine 2-epimerase